MKLQLINILKGATNVDYFFNEETNLFFITIEDFAGFDSNWEEIFQPVDDNGLVSFLTSNAKSVDEFNSKYDLGDCLVQLSYSSEDI